MTQRKVETILPEDTDACVSVWQSVIVQALYNAASNAEDLEQKLERAEAIAWFGNGMSGSEKQQQSDFEVVCDLAELCPHEVAKLAKEVIRNGGEVISGFNFRTLRRETSNRRPRKDKYI